MSNPPTVRPCIAPIQFLCPAYSPLKLQTKDIEGGTALLYEKNGKRYLVTARHVWEGFLEKAGKSRGKRHGAFVISEQGRLLPLNRDAITLKNGDSDIIVLIPDWLSMGLDGHDFYTGKVATVSVGDKVTTWGFPGSQRIITSSTVSCSREELNGEATTPFDHKFRFAASASYDMGGFSGAPVFRADSTLVGLVSEGNSFGIVTCCDLQNVLNGL